MGVRNLESTLEAVIVHDEGGSAMPSPLGASVPVQPVLVPSAVCAGLHFAAVTAGVVGIVLRSVVVSTTFPSTVPLSPVVD